VSKITNIANILTVSEAEALTIPKIVQSDQDNVLAVMKIKARHYEGHIFLLAYTPILTTQTNSCHASSSSLTTGTGKWLLLTSAI
jgi:hypothetical protein